MIYKMREIFSWIPNSRRLNKMFSPALPGLTGFSGGAAASTKVVRENLLSMLFKSFFGTYIKIYCFPLSRPFNNTWRTESGFYWGYQCRLWQVRKYSECCQVGRVSCSNNQFSEAICDHQRLGWAFINNRSLDSRNMKYVNTVWFLVTYRI